MPRPSGRIGRVSRPDMPVWGQFYVCRALEIRDNFTGAAMHTPFRDGSMVLKKYTKLSCGIGI